MALFGKYRPPIEPALAVFTGAAVSLRRRRGDLAGGVIGAQPVASAPSTAKQPQE